MDVSHSNPAVSLTPELNSNMSDHGSSNDGPSHSRSELSPSNDPTKKNLKTEYKSKFTPFDQYVYDEMTDQFVKHTVPVNNSIKASRSNQDINSSSNAANSLNGSRRQVITMTGHEADIYEPMESEQQHAEPWYKEVVRRNEKAHEYRFKSEIGHHSPLFNCPSHLELVHDRQMLSPSSQDSATNDQTTTTDSRSQFSDQHQDASNESKQTLYRFTPHDYRARDNLISYMANNNNFNLPKEQTRPSSRAPVGESSKTVGHSTTRSAASARARSQSSRRQPVTNSSNSQIPATKSSQTTPTKQTTSRVSGAGASSRPATSVSRYGPSTMSAASTRTITSTRVTSNATGAPRTTVATTRRTLVSSAKSTTGSKLSSSPNITASGARTTTTSSTAKSPTSTMTTNPSAASRLSSTTRSPASKSEIRSTNLRTTSQIAPGKLPNTSVKAPSTARGTALTSRAKPGSSSSSQNKQPSSQPPTAVKSIKTPKALAAQKGALAAVGGTVIAATVLAASGATESLKEPEVDQANLIEPNKEPQVIDGPFDLSGKSNLLTTTTKTGNMLADEIAQAELAVKQVEQSQTLDPESQVRLPRWADQSSEDNLAKTDEQQTVRSIEANNGADDNLINGLAGGLVSNEDRFDSSAEVSFNSTPGGKSTNVDRSELNENDEPYSLVPTSGGPRFSIEHVADEKRESRSDIDDVGGNTCELMVQDENSNQTIPISEQQVAKLESSDLDELDRSGGVDLISQIAEVGKESHYFDKDSHASVDEHSEGSIEGARTFEVKRSSVERDLLVDSSSPVHMSEKVDGSVDNDGSTKAPDAIDFDEPLDKAETTEPSNYPAEFRRLLHDDETAETIDPSPFKDKPAGETTQRRHLVDLKTSIEADVFTKSDELDTAPLTQRTNTIAGDSCFDEAKVSVIIDHDDDGGESAETVFREQADELAQNISSSVVNIDPTDKLDSIELIPSQETKDDLESADRNPVEQVKTKQTPIDDPIVIAEQIESHKPDSIEKQKQLVAQTDKDTTSSKATAKQLIDSDNEHRSDDGFTHSEEAQKQNELLINITDLMEAESRVKEEMVRKTEIARKNSSPMQNFVSQEGLLLSPAQLDLLTNQDIIDETITAKSVEATSSQQVDNTLVDHSSGSVDTSSESKSDPKKLNLTHENDSNDIPDDINEFSQQLDHPLEPRRNSVDSTGRDPEGDMWSSEDRDQRVITSHDINEASRIHFSDDIDSDEHLKLSNPLTNSEDELILQPRNYEYPPMRAESPSRYNEGAGLASELIPREDILTEDFELGDGSSAAIENPTVAENRIEMMSVSRSVSSEIAPLIHTAKLSRGVSDADPSDLEGSDDPIGAAATMDPDEVPLASVARLDNLLRFNDELVEASTIEPFYKLSQENLTKQHQADEMVVSGRSGYVGSASNDDVDGSSFGVLEQTAHNRADVLGRYGIDADNSGEPISPSTGVVTSDVFSDSSRQALAELGSSDVGHHGELHRRMSQGLGERKSSNPLDEQTLRRQQLLLSGRESQQEKKGHQL